ncbi:hypothetical protein GIW70_07970 [Pseudomonas syringae]|nr:hypothetical protein [Pseudomonas syringae]MCF5068133.1 hypothetical protein [Pseudomonas syringae]
MAKPPRKLPGTSAPDTPPAPPRNLPENTSATSERIHTGHVTQRTDANPDAPGSSTPRAVDTSGVTVTELPDARARLHASYLESISLPANQIDQLRPLGNDTALFLGPDDKTYAHVSGEGYYWVEIKPDGVQVPLPFAPNVEGPFLTRVDGQPLWRVERPAWYLQEGTPSPPAPIAGPSSATAIAFIPDNLASRLTQAHDSVEGLRYDKHKRIYIDTAQGTVMVQRRPDGTYQQKSASELVASGPIFEPVPNTKFWQRREQPQQEEAGPSKRPRLDRQTGDSSETRRATPTPESRTPDPLDLSQNLWRNWGKNTRPESGESVEINQLHYRIVPQGSQVDIVYLEHPGFSPARYDAFDQMLRDEPSLQPRWARKVEGQWEVFEARLPFERSLTQYTAGQFKYLSDLSVEATARTAFNKAAHAGVIDGPGISLLTQTMRFWSRAPDAPTPRRDLADPLMMLPVRSNRFESDILGGVLELPLPSDVAFQHVDLDPQKFPRQWTAYEAAPDKAQLRALFHTLLEDMGYNVNASTRRLSEDALLFHRDGIDAVFVLKFPHVAGNTIARYTLPGTEISSSVFQMRLNEADRVRLNAHLRNNQVIFLVGGVQQLSPDRYSLFIIRER